MSKFLKSRFVVGALLTAFAFSFVAATASSPAQAYDKNISRKISFSKKSFITDQYFNLQCSNKKWTSRIRVKWTKLSKTKARLEYFTIYSGKHKQSEMIFAKNGFYGYKQGKDFKTLRLENNKSGTVPVKKTYKTHGKSGYLGQLSTSVSSPYKFKNCIPIARLTIQFHVK